jgi:hypothetical protein
MANNLKANENIFTKSRKFKLKVAAVDHASTTATKSKRMVLLAGGKVYKLADELLINQR